MPDVISKCAGFFTLRCSTLVATFIAFALVTSAPAQGTVQFETRVPGVVDAPVYLWTGELADDDFVTLLHVGSNFASLIPVGMPLRFGTGPSAGYVGGDEVVVVPWASPGSDVYVRMRAWAPWGVPEEPPPYWGQSDVIRIQLGGGVDSPGYLVGLQGFTITPVPEPTTPGLGILGLAICASTRMRTQN